MCPVSQCASAALCAPRNMHKALVLSSCTNADCLITSPHDQSMESSAGRINLTLTCPFLGVPAAVLRSLLRLGPRDSLRGKCSNAACAIAIDQIRLSDCLDTEVVICWSWQPQTHTMELSAGHGNLTLTCPIIGVPSAVLRGLLRLASRAVGV